MDMYVTVEIRILRIICGIFTYVFFISADVAHAKWSSLGYATLIYMLSEVFRAGCDSGIMYS